MQAAATVMPNHALRGFMACVVTRDFVDKNKADLHKEKIHFAATCRHLGKHRKWLQAHEYPDYYKGVMKASIMKELC